MKNVGKLTGEEEPTANNCSVELLFDGQIAIKQRMTGYRYSLDPVIVSDFAKPLSGSKILDLGTGCGIIPILLSQRTSDLQITGIEIQQGLAEVAKENIEINNLQANISVSLSDIKKCLDFIRPLSVDMVVSNPPYTKKNAGRVNPDSERAIARHEIKIILKELVCIASKVLKTKGAFVVIYPEKRLSELLSVMNVYGINPERVRLVFPKNNGCAKLALVSGIKHGEKELVIEPPLYIYNDCGLYTEEMKKIFSDSGLSPSSR